MVNLDKLNIYLELLNFGLHLKNWVKDRRLPTKEELEPLAKAAQDMWEEFDKTYNDERWMRKLIDRLKKTDEIRANLMRDFLKSDKVSKSDKLLIRKLIFSAQKAEGEDAAFEELCHLVETPTFEGIKIALEDYRIRQSSSEITDPYAMLNGLKDRWEKVDFSEYENYIKKSDNKVTDDQVKMAVTNINNLIPGAGNWLKTFVK